MGIFVYSVIAIAIIGCSYATPLNSGGDLSRIVNGQNATENQFRYAISLQSLIPTEQMLPTRGHRCGGALITFGHALTTATCLHEEVDGESAVLIPQQYQVFAGSVSLTNTTADRIRSILNFTIHPNYIDPPAFVNDIGIIILASPFTAATVTPLSLPAANFNPPDFSTCQVAGWGGINSTEVTNPFLQFTNKYIYNQHLCSIFFNSQVGRPNVLPTMVCAASFDIVSSGCYNDNGNALVCGGTLTGILIVHDHCMSTSLPELYTRVSNHTAWITSVSSSPALFTSTAFIITTLFSIAKVMFNKY